LQFLEPHELVLVVAGLLEVLLERVVAHRPPGPIFYYGGLYGEICTRTKYNTALVTCGRFSTSSAAPPNSRN
jgi:hypothetical protein